MDLQKIVNKFGIEDTIYIESTSPQLAYYMFIKKYYFGKKAKLVPTHKCPFYHVIFWGTILMILTSFLTIPGYILSKVLSVINPVNTYIKKEKENKGNALVYSGITGILALAGAVVFILIGYGINLLSYIYYAFAIPWGALEVIWFILVSIYTGLGFVALWISRFIREIIYLAGAFIAVGVSAYITYFIVLGITSIFLKSRIYSKISKYLKERAEKKNELKKKQKAEEYKKKEEKKVKVYTPVRSTAHAEKNTIVTIFKWIETAYKYTIKPIFRILFLIVGGISGFIRALFDIASNHCPPIIFTATDTFLVKYDSTNQYYYIERNAENLKKFENRGIIVPKYHEYCSFRYNNRTLRVETSLNLDPMPKLLTCTYDLDQYSLVHKGRIVIRKINE